MDILIFLLEVCSLITAFSTKAEYTWIFVAKIFLVTEQNLYIFIIISIQPEGRLWQEPEPSQATGILGSFLGVGCHCFPLPLDVPTFAARCLHVQAT